MSLDYQSILQEMVSAYALHEIIVDAAGGPVDYRFLDVNPAFEKLTGLSRKQVIGRTILEVLPTIEPLWIERYGRVAQTGISDSFESYAEPLGKHFQVSAFCPKPGQFAVTFNDISERMVHQRHLDTHNQTLHNIQTELDAIYQSTPILMFVLDEDRRVVKINRATEKFTGLREEQAIGRRGGELFNCHHVYADGSCGLGDPCDSCLVRSSVLATLEGRQMQHGVRATLTVMTADGPLLRHLLLSTTPLLGSGRGRVLVCIDDISDFVEEQSLHFESEERYQALVEEGFDGIFIHRQHQILFLNQQLADILGFSLEEMYGSSAVEHFVLSSRNYIQNPITPNPRPYFEIDLRHKEGKLIRAECFSVDCHYQGEEATIVAVRDISPRKEAEEKLRASEQRYARLFEQFESLLDAVVDPISLLTRSYELLWTNRAFEQLREEIGSDERGLVFLPFFPKESDYPVRICFETGRPAEAQVQTPDQRTWELRAYPLRHQIGEGQVIVIATEITEKIRLREEASRASRLVALGELAAGVAHEINNPNALVLYNSELVQDIFQDLVPYVEQLPFAGDGQQFGGLSFSEACSEVPQLLSGIHGSSRRIKRIVDDLRDFSRDELSLEQEILDLNQVAEAAVRLTGNSIKKATRHFSLQLADNLPGVLGNAGRLEQVVVNLLLNACQALDSPDQEISLVTRLDARARQLVLQVIDRGHGIAAELLERLSEPFFTTRRDQGGTGLGLSVSSRIVKEHDGRLEFQSEQGRGTTITLMLPVAREGGTHA